MNFPAKSLLLLYVLLFAAVFVGHSAPTDFSKVKADLAAVPPGSLAKGTVRCDLRNAKSMVTVSVQGLQPLTEHTFLVGETPEAKFTTDRAGSKTLIFSSPPNAKALPLDFEPRGRELVIQGPSGAVLRGMVSGPGETGAPLTTESVALPVTREGLKVSASYQGSASPRSGDRRSLKVAVTGTSAPLSLYVDGVKRGDFVAGRKASLISFDSQPKNSSVQTLDFDPRGKVLDVVENDDGEVVASGALRAKILGVNEADPAVEVGFIASTGVDADALARTKSKTDSQARRKFEVELENLDLGTYELLADGVKVADIVVTADEDGGTEGEVEFVNYPSDDPDHLPLTFDIATAVFTVRLGATSYFDGPIIPASSGGSGTAHVEEYLTPTPSAPSGAKAKAEYEEDDDGDQEFSVEVENVPVGNYTLQVDGVNRGTIVVTLGGDDDDDDGGDDPEGKLEIKSPGFDPRGKLVEILNGASTVLFSHTFGSGSGPIPPESEEVEHSLPFVNLGILAPTAKAKLEFERDEDGQKSLEIELEQVPAGTYEILVDGVAIASVLRADGSGKAKLELEKAALTFDPPGKTISIRQQGSPAVCFERLVPAEW